MVRPSRPPVQQAKHLRSLFLLLLLVVVIVVVTAGFAYSVELDLFGAQLHRATAGSTGPAGTSGGPSRLQFPLALHLFLLALPPGFVQLGIAC